MWFTRNNLEKEFDDFFWEKRYFVRFLVKHYIDDFATVDDLVQMVFIKLYTSFKKIRKIENVDGYIHRLTVNEVMTFFRKNKKHTYELSNSDEILNFVEEGSRTPEIELLDSELKELLVSLISKLPSKRRYVTSFRLFNQKSFKEIGEILSISNASARNLYSIAIKQIRKDLLLFLK